MAKKRKLNNPSLPAPQSERAQDSSTVDSPVKGSPFAHRIEPMNFAAAIFVGLAVYATYYPSDSVAVEKGDALWFSLLAIVVATVTWTRWLWNDSPNGSGERSGQKTDWIDFFAWSIPIWIAISGLCTCPPGNLRMATNEIWVWVAGAAVFTTGRRLLISVSTRRAVVAVLIACSVGVAVHGLHQQWVSFPRNQAQFEANPDRMLREAGLDAPEGSAQRMIFRSRLYDGGPTGTFALANSLAGVLVVGSVASVCLILFRWAGMTVWIRGGMVACLAILAMCSWYANSRSAMAATMLGCVVVAIAQWFRGRDESQARRQQALWLFAGTTIGGLVLVCLIGAFGKREWFEQAPASLSFRFQYWRTTLAMALDRPLFGVGPGNFQSIYERYREASASEQIADPHNWLFETLASGGFIGLGLTLMLMFFGLAHALKLYRSTILTNAESNASGSPFAANSDDPFSIDTKWIALGSGCAVVLVWLVSFGVGVTPDIEAHLFAIPLAVALGLLSWLCLTGCSGNELDRAVLAMLLALMVHLLASGGWTIPGVAIHVWILGAIVVRFDFNQRIEDQSSDVQESRKRLLDGNAAAYVALALGAVLIGLLRFGSIGPVDSARMAMLRVENAERAIRETQTSSTGVSGMMRRKYLRHAQERVEALEDAIQADPWSPDASLVQSDSLRWLVVQSEPSAKGSAAVRSEWESSVQETLRRGGDDPNLYRLLAGQYLHVFQRWGRQEDFSRGMELLEQAAKWSPANEWIAAQLAEVYRASGEQKKSLKWAEKADFLTSRTANAQRSLRVQLIYELNVIGRPAERGPRLLPATELLANQLDRIRVSDQN